MEPLSRPPRTFRQRLREFAASLGRLNRGYASVDRAAHGALRFNTAVKFLGWVGLCAIVLLLAQKVREIEERMDPVKNGLARLQVEVDRAEVAMGSETQASQRELTSLEARARSLKQTLDRASTEHRRHGQRSLEEADREAQELADQLGRDEESARAVAVQRETAAKALADYARELGLARATLAGDAQAIADGGASTLDGYSALRRALADQTEALRKAPAPAALDQLTVEARALSARLTRLEAKLTRLEADLPTFLPRPVEPQVHPPGAVQPAQPFRSKRPIASGAN